MTKPARSGWYPAARFLAPTKALAFLMGTAIVLSACPQAGAPISTAPVAPRVPTAPPPATARPTGAVRAWSLSTDGVGNPSYLAWSPDGSKIAASGRITSVFDATTFRPLVGLEMAYAHLGWNADGSRLVIWDGGSFNEYDARTWRRLIRWDMPAGTSLLGAVLSPTGRWVATRSYDSTASQYSWKLRDANSGEAALDLGLATGNSSTNLVAWSPTDEAFAIVSPDFPTIRIVSVPSGQLRSFAVPTGESVNSVAYSLDGARLLVASTKLVPSNNCCYTRQAVLSLYRASDGAPLFTRAAGTSYGSSARYSGDGSRILAFSDVARLYSPDLAQETLGAPISGNDVWSPDGSEIIAPHGYSTSFGYLTVTDAITGVEKRNVSFAGNTSAHQGNLYATAWNQPLGLLATAGRDSRLHLYDLSYGNPDRQFDLEGGTDSVYALAWNPSGSRLASAGKDGAIQLWRAENVTDTSDPNNPYTYLDVLPDASLIGHTYTVRGLAWSPDGTRLASGGWDKAVRVWDPLTGDQTQTLTGHTDFVNAVAYSPDGLSLASASSDATVKLWNPATGLERLSLTGHADAVVALAWSPDGSRLATGSLDKTVRLWDTASGTLQRTITVGLGAVRAVTWLDANTVLSGDDEGRMRAWDTANGAKLFEAGLPGGAPVFSLAQGAGGLVIGGLADGSLIGWTLTY